MKSSKFGWWFVPSKFGWFCQSSKKYVVYNPNLDDSEHACNLSKSGLDDSEHACKSSKVDVLYTPFLDDSKCIVITSKSGCFVQSKSYCLNREPRFFHHTWFVVDHFHWCGPIGSYSLDAYHPKREPIPSKWASASLLSAGGWHALAKQVQ